MPGGIVVLVMALCELNTSTVGSRSFTNGWHRVGLPRTTRKIAVPNKFTGAPSMRTTATESNRLLARGAADDELILSKYAETRVMKGTMLMRTSTVNLNGDFD